MNNKENLVYIPITELHPHPDNPRKDVGDVTELAESIKSKGVMQNLTVVRGRHYIDNNEPCYNPNEGFTVIIGHRRMAASKMAGLTELPCVVVQMEYKDQIATMLLENMQRSDLTMYEQAQGFQMMLDLGETQTSIAAQTGFSQTTVSKRLKLLSLDKKKFQSAELRGGTLEDYIKAAEIKDVRARNKVTDAIGTSNFAWEFKTAMRHQKYKEALPAIQKEMRSISAKKQDSIYPWSDGYEVVARVDIDAYKEGYLSKKAKAGTEYFYNICNEREVCLFKKKPKQKKQVVKKSGKEIKADEKRKELKQLTAQAYELRQEFISNYSACKKNADIINEWLWEMQYRKLSYDLHTSITWKLLCEKLGEEKENYRYKVDREKLDKYVQENPNNAPIVILSALCCGEAKECYYYEGYGESAPTHKENKTLDFLYKYLCKLGYEMSDTEKALQNGTHKAFAKG